MSVFDWMDRIKLGLPRCPGWADSQPSGVSLSCDGSGLGGGIILDGSAKPIARARFPIQPGTDCLVTNEFHVLTELGNHGRGLEACAPKPLGLLNLGAGPVAYYPYIKGRTVQQADVIADDNFSSTVVGWLANMHGCLGQHRVLDSGVFEQWVTAPANAAAAKASPDRNYRQALEDGLELASGIIGESMPSGIAHRDLWCENALRSEDGAGFCAIDWSMAVMEGIPMFDLMYWYLYNIGLWHSTDMVGAAEMCIRSESVCGDRFREAMSTYCELLQWSPKRMESWLVAFIIHSYSVRAEQAGSDFLPLQWFGWLYELPKVAELGDELGRSLRTYERDAN